MEKRKVTCRHCQEKNNWEIETPNGEVLEKHYPNKEECLKAGLRYAEECGCDLCICSSCENDQSCHKRYR